MKVNLTAAAYADGKKLYEIKQKNSPSHQKVSFGRGNSSDTFYITETFADETEPWQEVEDELRLRVLYYTGTSESRFMGFNLKGYEDNLIEAHIDHKITASGFEHGGHLIAPVTGEFSIIAKPKKNDTIEVLDLKMIIDFLDDANNIKDGLASRMSEAKITGTFTDELLQNYNDFFKDPKEDTAIELNSLLNASKKDTYLKNVDMKWKENQDITRLYIQSYQQF